MQSYQTARQRPATVRAYNTLQQHFAKGRNEGMALFEKIKKLIIVDYMVFTDDMSFTASDHRHQPPLYFATLRNRDGSPKETMELELHPHAFSQMTQAIGVSKSSVNNMGAEKWEREDLAGLMNSRFTRLDFKQRGGGKDRFMNRVVDGKVRGFVSRMFARHLSSGPILEAFVKSSSKFGAQPASAITTDLRFTLRTFLPHVFEPTDGEYIAIGCSCSNSDFGSGTLRIGLCVLRVRGGTVSHVRDVYTGYHRGKADNSADVSVELSQDTIKKQIQAKQSEIEDVVMDALHPKKVNDFLDTIAKATEKQISWHKLERYLQGKLTQAEVQEIQLLLEKGDETGELPSVQKDADNNAIADLWWASSAISKIADRQTGDRKEELQSAAGALLTK